MQKFFGVEIDTSTMTLEELQELLAETRELLAIIEYQILIRKMASRKYSSCSSESNSAKD